MLVVTLLLLPLQWVPALHIGSYEVKRPALLADVVAVDAIGTDTVDLPLIDVPEAPAGADCTKEAARKLPVPEGVTPIADYADESQRGMKPLYLALDRCGKMDRPVRIAYFGDSFIEVDILTAALRQLMQKKFGGHGVGFLDMAPPYAANRSTVRQRYGGWDARCVLDKGRYRRELLGIGQRYFLPKGTAWTELGGVRQPGLDSADVHTIYLKCSSAASVGVKLDDGPMLALRAEGNGRTEALKRKGRAGRTRWQVSGGEGTVCWGVAEESRRGVIVDNFSLRGSSGTTLGEIPEGNLKELHGVRPYDLIVLQFGLNVASKSQKDYSHYASQMQRVVEHMKASFPEAGILVVGVGDREDRSSDGQLRTLPGIPYLLRYQQRMAADCKVAFWNLYEGMGGEGSIRRMTEMHPAEAGKDYTHINMHGDKRIADHLFKSLIYGYEQYRQNR